MKHKLFKESFIETEINTKLEENCTNEFTLNKQPTHFRYILSEVWYAKFYVAISDGKTSFKVDAFRIYKVQQLNALEDMEKNYWFIGY